MTFKWQHLIFITDDFGIYVFVQEPLPCLHAERGARGRSCNGGGVCYFIVTIINLRFYILILCNFTAQYKTIQFKEKTC